MKMKKTLLFTISFVFILSSTSAQSLHKAYLDYINTYSFLAIEQQHMHQIPASIKLAQGLLESGAGTSKLALTANNHFGIKCHNWQGATTYADDDAKNECFRKYKTVRESYEDHSNFLKTRNRYSSLFNLESTDYKSWAHGLKAAGYATDPNYATKLIKLIDDYDLHKYDIGQIPDSKISNSKYNQEYYVWGQASSMTLTGHQLMRNNGVNCVYAESGDTYASIANEFNISLKKILQYNDLDKVRALEAGTIVYIAKKKKKASAEFNVHTVKTGENMYRISQKYAIRLQSLYDLNQMQYTEGAKVGMTLLLK